MIILGIETSCDETSASVIRISRTDGFAKPLSNMVSSQIKLHARWGGVVPNLAAREHLKNILPVIESALDTAGIGKNEIDLIAVTSGPGLIPALLVGTAAAKTLAYAWKKPLIGIHHIEGHIYANFIGKRDTDIPFPVLTLVVSGGHTQLILMEDHLDYRIIGETQDDAVGEAFDKVARILDLGYPGGPAIASEAQKQPSKFARDYDISLPRPMINSGDFNFSFSGLKTAALYATKKNEDFKKNPDFISSMSREFQQAVIDVLTAKTIAAAKKYGPRSILVAGGVSANLELQKQLQEAVKHNFPNTLFSCPEPAFQLDNAAMIAAAAYFRCQKTGLRGLSDGWKNTKTDANLKMSDR